ncbi:MAG: VWA domain-containing protein [Deltaproteobacteria bacterium]
MSTLQMKRMTPLFLTTVIACASTLGAEDKEAAPTDIAEERYEDEPGAAGDSTRSHAKASERRSHRTGLGDSAPAPAAKRPAPPPPAPEVVAKRPERRRVSPDEVIEMSGTYEDVPPSARTLDPSSSSVAKHAGKGDTRARFPGDGADTTASLTLPAEPEPRRRRGPPKSPGVKAGASDDNLSYAAYLDFLEKHRHHGYHSDLSDRVIVEVQDQRGKPIPDVEVELRYGPGTLQRRRTYADGRTLLFPSDTGRHRQDLSVRMTHAGLTKTVQLADERTHRIQFKLLRERKDFENVPLDVAFVLDTTGSMGDELLRLKQTIETIHFQIEHMSPRPDVRFGLVTYRDRGDAYVTQHVDFTRDLGSFTRELGKVQAGGGNDYPEDVQAGLASTLHDLEWRSEGVKLAFLVGDAPPHFDYGQRFTYLDAAREAAERGIKIATIGASGLSETGELVWRQLAQFTMAPFVFLTYGEKGDSGAGTPALVSHHVGSNWVAENLDAIVVRMVKVELAHLTPRGAPTREDYFAASRSDDVPKDLVLEDLFSQSVKQLLDYSVERIEPRTPTVLMPIASAKKLKADTDKLGRRLMVGLSRRAQFQLLEHEDRGAVLEQLAEQLSAKYDASRVSDVGRLVPAKLAVLSSLAPGDGGKVEMLVKLVRLETGEVLSLSLLKIDQTLLL